MGEYGGELGRDERVAQTEQAAKRLVGSESSQVRRRVGEGWPRQSHPAYCSRWPSCQRLGKPVADPWM